MSHESSNSSSVPEPTAGPISSTATVEGRADSEVEEEDEKQSAPASPLLWRRLRNIFIVLAFLWLATVALRATDKKPKVLHANRCVLVPIYVLIVILTDEYRYSEEFKFRPAASPIITETLRDGRTRLRGAEPTTRAMALAHETPQARNKKGKKKRGSKSRKGGKKGKA